MRHLAHRQSLPRMEIEENALLLHTKFLPSVVERSRTERARGDRFGLVVAVGHDGSMRAAFPHDLLPDSLSTSTAFAIGDFEILDIRSAGSRPAKRRAWRWSAPAGVP